MSEPNKKRIKELIDELARLFALSGNEDLVHDIFKKLDKELELGDL